MFFVKYRRQLTLLLTLSFSIQSVAMADSVGPICKNYIELDEAQSYHPLEGVEFTLRNLRPSRMEYKNINREKLNEIILKYQDDQTSSDQWQQDFRKRVATGDYVPEELFAYVVLSGPPENSLLVSQLISNEGVWIKKRSALTEFIFRKNKDLVTLNNKMLVSQFSFPRDISDAEFDRAVQSLIVAIAQVDFTKPHALDIFKGPKQGLINGFIRKISGGNFKDSLRADLLKSVWTESLKGILENDATLKETLLKIQDELKAPRSLTPKATLLTQGLTPEEKIIIQTEGHEAYLNYLVSYKGKKVAATWALSVFYNAMLIWGLASLGSSVYKMLTVNNGGGIGGGGPSPGFGTNPVASDDDKKAFSMKDDLISKNQFYPFDDIYIADTDKNQPNPCDPQRQIQKFYNDLMSKMSSDEMLNDPKYVKVWLPWARAEIKKQWQDSKSGCRTYVLDHAN